MIIQTVGCTCSQCNTTRDANAWIALLDAARKDRAARVARRSPQAPSLTLHAADYGLAPVRRWGMTDRAVAINRKASGYIVRDYARARRMAATIGRTVAQTPTPVAGDFGTARFHAAAAFKSTR